MGLNSDNYEYHIEFNSDSQRKWDALEQKEEYHPALYQLAYTLKTTPHAFKPAYPMPHIRIAKTEKYSWHGQDVPQILVYFQIVEDDKTVKVIDVQTFDDIIGRT